MACKVGLVALCLLLAGSTLSAQEVCSADVLHGSCTPGLNHGEDQLALLQTLSKRRADGECPTPMPAACSILLDVTASCCAASQDLFGNNSIFCSECKDSANTYVQADFEQFCKGDAAPSALVQQASAAHFGRRLLQTLQNRVEAREFRSALAEKWESADVCTAGPEDCSIQVGPQFMAIFKSIGQTACCSSLKPILASPAGPASYAVSAFCNACKTAKDSNADVDLMYQSLTC